MGASPPSLSVCILWDTSSMLGHVIAVDVSHILLQNVGQLTSEFDLFRKKHYKSETNKEEQ